MIVVDMKKPETCADCPIINGEYGICEILDREVWGIPPKDCPIVGEIPDKHGDIKDTKDILDRLAIKPTHDAVSTLLSIQAAVDESPTIIEASKEIEADDRT